MQPEKQKNTHTYTNTLWTIQRIKTVYYKQIRITHIRDQLINKAAMSLINNGLYVMKTRNGLNVI